jgi:hypothetical protein
VIALHPDDTRLDPRALLLTGRAILLWPSAATQPHAVVVVPRGAFTTRLCGAPYNLELLVESGAYPAKWDRGRVLVTAT